MLDVDPKLYKTPNTKLLQRYDSLGYLEKNRLISDVGRSIGYVARGVLPNMLDPVRVVKKGYALPLYTDAALLASLKRPSGWGGDSWEATLRVLKQNLKIIEDCYNGEKPTRTSLDLRSAAKGKLIAKWIEWYMTVYYHYAWAERIQTNLMTDVAGSIKGFTAEQQQIFQDSIDFLKTDYAKKVNASAKGAAGLAVMKFFRYAAGGTYYKAPWRETRKMRESGDYFDITTELGAAIYAVPHLTFPTPMILAEELGPHVLTASVLRDLIIQDSKQNSTIKAVWTHVQELLQTKDRIIAKIQQEIVTTTTHQAEAAAAQAASDAGILTMPTTPFWQKPAFTLAVAGGIFGIGYTIIRRKKR